MDLAYVKGFEHRSMAVGLPYVLHNLVPATDLGERLAVSYATWRKTIDHYEFSDAYNSYDAHNSCNVGPTLEQVEIMGRQLQLHMNELKQWLRSDPDVEFEGMKNIPRVFCSCLTYNHDL